MIRRVDAGFARPRHSTRRRSGSSCAPATADWQQPVLRSSYPGTRSRARISRRSGPTASTTRRRASRSGAAPSSSALGARQAAHARSEPWLLGAAPCVPRSARPAVRLVGSAGGSGRRGCGKASSTSTRPGSTLSPSLACLTIPGVEHLYGAGRTGSISRSGLARVATRRSGASSCAVLLHTASTGRRSSGGFGAKMRPTDSAVFLPRSPHYRPNWSGYRYRPAQARRLLEQAGCRQGNDGIYCCAGERLSLRFITAADVSGGGSPSSSPSDSCGRRVSRSNPSSNGSAFDQMVASGDFDVQLFRLVLLAGPGLARTSSAAEASRTSPATASGSSRATSIRLDLIFDARRRAPVQNRADRADGEGRAGDPALEQSLRPPRSGRRSVASSRAFHPLPGTRRTGGSRSSPGSGDRRFAPRRVGSGRHGRSDAAGGGTVVFGPIPEPPCLNLLVSACATSNEFFWITEKVLTPRFAVGPGLDAATEARLTRHVHANTAVHAHLRDPPERSLERRRPRQCPGLRLYAPGVSQVPQQTLVPARLTGRCGPSVRWTRRRSWSILRSRVGDWRSLLFPFVLPQHALVGENLKRIWMDGIDNPKTGRPIGSGPFLSSAGSEASSSRLSGTRATGARTLPTSSGS